MFLLVLQLFDGGIKDIGFREFWEQEDVRFLQDGFAEPHRQSVTPVSPPKKLGLMLMISGSGRDCSSKD